MQRIPTFRPKIEITVAHYAPAPEGASERVVSNRLLIWRLDPYLGVGSSVQTTKSIYQPKGTFSITIPDRPVNLTGDTLYAQLSPMDSVEIRMARSPHEYPNRRPPVIMRGFIGSVHRQETITDSGEPRRQIVIQGFDYGKILEMIQIYYGVGYKTGEVLQTQYALFQRFKALLPDDAPASMTMREFIRRVFLAIVNPYLLGMAALRMDALIDAGEGDSVIDQVFVPAIIPDVALVEDSLYWVSLGSHQGTLWGLLAREADLSWHEMFIEDRDLFLDGEAGTYFVYRPNPFRDAAGDWIEQPGFEMPEFIERDGTVVKALSPMRNDANVANIFDVQAPRAMPWVAQNYAIQMFVLPGEDQQWVYMTDYPYNDPELYGDRRLSVTANQHPPFGPAAAANKGRLKAAEIEEGQSAVITWAKERRKALARMVRDNAVWESGVVVLRGDERIRAGRYLRLNRGSTTQEMYLASVTQTFNPFQSYTTSARFIRGDGWLRRQQEAANPALREKGAGLYRGGE